MIMSNRLYTWIKKYLFKIDVRSQLEIAISEGLKIGKNVNIQGECIIDPAYPWLIEIGDNVTLAHRVYILAHDASSKIPLGYSMIGKVIIGNNVFVGANTTILPNVSIGNNVVIGAGSVVTHSIPNNSIAAGNPAKVIDKMDSFIQKRKEMMKTTKVFDKSYSLFEKVSIEKKNEMKNAVNNQKAFIY